MSHRRRFMLYWGTQKLRDVLSIGKPFPSQSVFFVFSFHPRVNVNMGNFLDGTDRTFKILFERIYKICRIKSSSTLDFFSYVWENPARAQRFSSPRTGFSLARFSNRATFKIAQPRRRVRDRVSHAVAETYVVHFGTGCPLLSAGSQRYMYPCNYV